MDVQTTVVRQARTARFLPLPKSRVSSSGMEIGAGCVSSQKPHQVFRAVPTIPGCAVVMEVIYPNPASG